MKINNRVLDAVGQWEYGKTYTLDEMFYKVIATWDNKDINAFYYDMETLLTYIFSKIDRLQEQDHIKLPGLRKNCSAMYTDGDKFPANFYGDSKVYKYQHRSCTNCILRPTCALHQNKDWSVKWVDNGRAGCTKYCGPYSSEKRLKSRDYED